MAMTLQEWMNDATNQFPVNKSLDYSSQIQTVTTCRGKVEQAQLIIKDAYTKFSDTMPVLLTSIIAECNEQYDLYKEADDALGYMEEALANAQQVAVVEQITGHEIDFEPDDCMAQTMVLNLCANKQLELYSECNKAEELLQIPKEV